MTTNGSATLREETPHAKETTNTTNSDAVRRRPQSIINDEKSSVEKIETLTEIICRAGGECAAALFVLMGTLQNSAEPEALANAAKHYAFTRCGELNIFGMVDAQIAVLEGELLASTDIVS